MKKIKSINKIEEPKLISFRKSVLSLFMLASFFPAFLAGLPFVSRILDLEEKNAQDRLSFLGQSTAYRIESALDVLKAKIDTLALDRDFSPPQNHIPLEEIETKFSHFLQSNPLPSSIYLFGTNAKLKTTAPEALKAQKHLPFLQTIKNAMNKTNFPLNKTILSWDENYANEHWSTLSKSNDHNSFAFIFEIKFLVDGKGKISGAIVVAVPSQRLNHIVYDTIGPKVRARLLALNGPIVTVPYHANELIETYTKEEIINKVGDEISSSTRLIIGKSSKAIPLILKVWEPESQHKAPILESTIWIAGLLIIIVIFFGYVGYLVALWLLRPMKVLSSKVNEYSHGQYQSTPSKVDFAEFNEFLNLLESMAQQIEEQIEEVAERRKRETFLEKEKIQAKLSALRFQMNPHFLFNALNNVAAMISIDKNTAQEMLVKLSALYHKILNASQHTTIPLSDEISIVRDYIYLQQSRFGDRLQYKEQLPAHFDDVEIPGMLLQTLVENAVKHGIEKARRGGLVEININKNTDGVSMKVINTGRAYVPTSESKGFGLINTRKRLESIYGDRFSFELSSDSNQRTVANIWIGSKRGKSD